MTRAAVSIPSNIAEGYERGSNKEFRRFLNIASGSAAELRTQLYIAYSIELINKETKDQLIEETRGIGAMLRALSKSRADKTNEPAGHYEVDGSAFSEPGNRNPEPGS